MNENMTYTYNYSAQQTDEAEQIRKKYLPKEESKLEELKRLDRTVQNAGVLQSLILGILSCLLFGMGMCFGLEVLAGGRLTAFVFGITGTVGMLLAYRLQRVYFKIARKKYVPRIMELSAELMGTGTV